MSYDAQGNNIVAPPQQITATANQATPTTAQPTQQTQPVQQTQPTFAENTGKQAGIVAEKTELGKQRAEAIGDLDKEYEQITSNTKTIAAFE